MTDRAERGVHQRSTDAEDKWYADLEVLSAAHRKSEASRKRQRAIAAFVVFAFLVLSVRSEINADRTSENARRISDTQRITCESGRAILAKSNQQQEDLIAIETANTTSDPVSRAARIKAYEDGRIDPLPICD